MALAPETENLMIIIFNNYLAKVRPLVDNGPSLINVSSLQQASEAYLVYGESRCICVIDVMWSLSYGLQVR